MTKSPVLLLFLLCKQLLYGNGTGHVEQLCEKFMPTLPVYHNDLFSLLVLQELSWEYHSSIFDGWWFLVDILHVWLHKTCSWFSFDIHNEHVSRLVWTCTNYISSCSVGPAPLHHPHNKTQLFHSLLTPARALAPSLQKEIVPAASVMKQMHEMLMSPKKIPHNMDMVNTVTGTWSTTVIKPSAFYGAITHEVHILILHLTATHNVLERCGSSKTVPNLASWDGEESPPNPHPFENNYSYVMTIIKHPFTLDYLYCQCLFHSTSQCCRICLHHCHQMLKAKFKCNLRNLRQDLMRLNI